MAKRDIEAFPPLEHELQTVVSSLISDLFEGKTDNGRVILKDVVESAYKYKDKKQKSVCLACTELPLAFSGKEQTATFVEGNVIYLNSTIIHAKAAFDYAVQ